MIHGDLEEYDLYSTHLRYGDGAPIIVDAASQHDNSSRMESSLGCYTTYTAFATRMGSTATWILGTRSATTLEY